MKLREKTCLGTIFLVLILNFAIDLVRRRKVETLCQYCSNPRENDMKCSYCGESKKVSYLFWVVTIAIAILVVFAGYAHAEPMQPPKPYTGVFCNTPDDVLAFADQHFDKGLSPPEAIKYVNSRVGTTSCGPMKTYIFVRERKDVIKYESQIVGIYEVDVASVFDEGRWRIAPSLYRQYTLVFAGRKGVPL